MSELENVCFSQNQFKNYKNNYIDVSLERSANAYSVAQGIAAAVNHESDDWNWFIS